MEYLYLFANASLTLRVVNYLHSMPGLPIDFISIIHLIDGWVVRVKMKFPLTIQQDRNFRAFLSELGILFEPQVRLKMALLSLEFGQSLTEVIRRYQVVVVSHGSPDQRKIEAFRHWYIKGLGYCPETLA